MVEIKISKVAPDIPLPQYQHENDVGLDLPAAENEVIPAGEYKLIATGLKIAIPKGYAGFVYPRSGLALKYGVTVLNADGVIDPGYRGEIGVLLINHGKESFNIAKGDRIAQLIVQKVADVSWLPVENLKKTSRGTGGFGHTGK